MSDQEENEQDFEAGEAEDAEDIMDAVIGVPLTKGLYSLTHIRACNMISIGKIIPYNN